MVLGDGIRRDIAHVSSEERGRFRDAIAELQNRLYPGSRDDPIPGGVSEWFKQDEIHQATHVHGGPAFLPWHRELCNRYEELLRAVDPDLSLHYWDWTTDPRAAPDGQGGTINLFTAEFMGGSNGDAGQPWLGAGLYDPGADPFRADNPFDANNNPADPPRTLTRNISAGPPTNIDSDEDIVTSADHLPQAQQWNFFRRVVEGNINHQGSPGNFNHNRSHGYIGGTIGNPHTAFRDPFVFMLHSNVDRLFAMWQAAPGETWRLDPGQVYGDESGTGGLTGLASLMEPWAGNPDNSPSIHPVRPWAPPENEQEAIDSLHPSVVWPPCYDTLPFSVDLTTPSAGAPLTFMDVPEGQTTVRAVVFAVTACHALTLEIIDGPGPGFGTPLGTSIGTGPPSSFNPAPAHVWISYTGTTAGDAASGSVTIRCQESDEQWVVPITANTVAKPTVASMLVLDKSGSMAWASGVTDFPTRVQLLRFAAPHFVELLDDHDGVGLVSFDHNAQAVMAVQPAGAPVFGLGRVEAKQSIHSVAFNPGGATSIGAGVEVGHAGLDPLTGFDHKAMVVFTDGFENYPPYLADVAGLIGARVYAIGLGTAQHLNPGALEALTSGTGGHLLLTGDLDTNDLFRLSKYFLQILAGVTNADIVVDPESAALPQQEHRIAFDLNEADVDSDVILLSPAPWAFEFTLETPAGTVISQGISPAGVTFADGEQVHFYRVRLPVVAGRAPAHAGTWHAVLRVDEGNFTEYLTTLRKEQRDPRSLKRARAHGVPYNLSVHSHSNVNLRVGVHSASNEPGADVTVRARLTEYGLPASAAGVDVELTRPDDTVTTIVLPHTEPGVFEGTFTAQLPGIHRLLVRASGHTLRGAPFTREALRTTAVWPGGNAAPPSRATDPRARDEELCRLLECLVDERTLGRFLAQHGIEQEALRRCIQRFCGERVKPPDF